LSLKSSWCTWTPVIFNCIDAVHFSSTGIILGLANCGVCVGRGYVGEDFLAHGADVCRVMSNCPLSQPYSILLSDIFLLCSTQVLWWE
jgi:hypothetical protein